MSNFDGNGLSQIWFLA